jgi:predicted DCC family thiol-disulfide oxidoreductase YuxK
MPLDRTAYSYRDDPGVPAFADARPLIVFDGVCILCHGFARFIARVDTARLFQFTHAQSPLGQGFFRHYGLDPVTFETNLLVADGKAYGKLAAFSQIMRRLGWPWSAIGQIVRVVPAVIGNPAYDIVARNRYRLFGRHEFCAIPDASWRQRLIGDPDLPATAKPAPPIPPAQPTTP